jgi:hypothetical protein
VGDLYILLIGGYEAIDLEVETGTENSNAVVSNIHTVSPKGEGSSA